MKIVNIFEKQRIFKENEIDYNTLKQQLKKLKNVIISNENAIYEAFQKDLNKHKNEAYLMEYSPVLNELNWFIKNIKKIHKFKKMHDPLWIAGHKSGLLNEPYGNVLIYSPYNYPFFLMMVPLIGALACGNTAIVKMSSSTTYINKLLIKIISSVFTSQQCYLIDTKNDEWSYKELYNLDFDLVFFTGSGPVGKEVYANFSKKLIPVILELGGKSPTIVDETANLAITARRLIWAKMANNGQTCVAPDYLIIHENIYDKFISAFDLEWKKQFDDQSQLDTVVKLIKKNSQTMLKNLLANQEIIKQYPISEGINFSLIKVPLKEIEKNKIMQTELFCPILPVIKYKTLDEVFKIINLNPYPLATYLFSNSKQTQTLVAKKVKAGSLVINDCIIQLIKHLPFGGIKNSGLSHYHKEWSVEIFSHAKPIVKSSKGDFNCRYRPYNDKKFKWMKKLLK